MTAWENDRGRRTPVIAMTGHASADERARFLGAGMDDYLAKPVVLHDLGAILGQWLASPSAAPGTDSSTTEPGTATEPKERPPIDMNLLGEILGDDDETEKLDWVAQFIDQFAPLLEDMAAPIDERDRAATREAAHAAKSAATCAAAVPLTDALQRLETETAAADWADLLALTAAARAEFDRVVGFRGNQRKPT